eukprot:scaffold392043_cov41-Prasinocladus_malaysianus.AAC.1
MEAALRTPSGCPARSGRPSLNSCGCRGLHVPGASSAARAGSKYRSQPSAGPLYVHLVISLGAS